MRSWILAKHTVVEENCIMDHYATIMILLMTNYNRIW